MVVVVVVVVVVFVVVVVVIVVVVLSSGGADGGAGRGRGGGRGGGAGGDDGDGDGDGGGEGGRRRAGWGRAGRGGGLPADITYSHGITSKTFHGHSKMYFFCSNSRPTKSYLFVIFLLSLVLSFCYLFVIFLLSLPGDKFFPKNIVLYQKT